MNWKVKGWAVKMNGEPCKFCGKPINYLRDAISVKEWNISGMCQMCQDKVFGK